MGHKNNDPHQKLESLERWSARATLLILLGIVIEIGLLLWFPHNPIEKLVAIIADALIGIGLAVEYIVILRAVVASWEATRLSDEKIAESNRQAAEADQKAQEAILELARFKASRVFDPNKIAEKMKVFPNVKYSVAVSITDPEYLMLIALIEAALEKAGWSEMTILHFTDPWARC